MAGIKQVGVDGKFAKGDIYAVAITKAKKDIELNTGDLPEASIAEIMYLGLKTFLNKGMADIKITGLEGTELEKAQAVALDKANESLNKLLSGEFRKSAKAAKVSGKVMTEARRIARNIVKDELKRAGHKVSHYPAAEITKAANALIEADASILDQAKASLEQQAAKTVAIDLSAIKTDPELVKKAEAKKKGGPGKAPLSATQAGLVAPRQRPQGQPTIRH